MVKKNSFDVRDNENKVLLWDDNKKSVIGEISCKSRVQRIFLRKDYITIVLRKRIYIYKLEDLTLYTSIETGENPKTICSITTIKDSYFGLK